MSISESTLRHLKRGNLGSDAGAYLAAQPILGVLDEATPLLASVLWSDSSQRRVKLSRQERESEEDADYF